ncbi:hypothetical protein CA13_30320 [Planctomycetes bacterium CA13]|uniref:Glycoside hydrolase family 42 N-terminal domain-containing protein n=1 Tax=Novipirellula herctigrandis TaxID=2527986 RepID=A0A5C5Z2J8_9BACT|nr:hypothetical protein CA13_30320 [Planctomycetes bacterium CA13]
MQSFRFPAICVLLIGIGLPLFAGTASTAELDKYGGTTAIKGDATGFFHVEEIDGRSWFITPEGNAFFAVALSHMLSGESDVACQNVYGGNADKWLKDSFEKARAMGFNCALGSATSPERNLNGFVDVPKAEKLFREANFPFAVGVILLKHPWEFVDGETLPDIFHPDYEQLIRSRAAQVCPRYKDDPLCMGYYYGFGAFNQSDQWVNHHLSLPQGSPGREVLSDLLIKRYAADVKKFNAAYGTSLKDMSELKSSFDLVYEKEYERRNYPRVGETLDKQKLADFEAIVSHMCVTLYRIGHESIRRWDGNHLILGSFIKEWALSIDSWKKTAPYVDMIAPQHVNEFISVNDIADATNLPIIMSDDYFGFHYPGKTGSLHAGLVSHEARGEVYYANLMRHFKDPQVLGVTYCACMYDQGGNTLAKNNQNGFYSLDGKPREKLIEVVTELNGAVYKHAGDPASPEELEGLHTELFGKWKEHSIRRGR